MKSKIGKIPIYCFNCGSELKQEKFISHYDEESGEAQYRVRVHCKICQENGNSVYHQQEWELNSQDKEEECEHHVGEGVIGISENGEKPESGYFCSECGKYISTTERTCYPQDTPEEWWKEMHDMLKPYHLEGEDYIFTLRRILDKLNNKKK